MANVCEMNIKSLILGVFSHAQLLHFYHVFYTMLLLQCSAGNTANSRVRGTVVAPFRLLSNQSFLVMIQWTDFDPHKTPDHQTP